MDYFRFCLLYLWVIRTAEDVLHEEIAHSDFEVSDEYLEMVTQASSYGQNDNILYYFM